MRRKDQHGISKAGKRTGERMAKGQAASLTAIVENIFALAV